MQKLKIIHFFSPHPYFQKIAERRLRKIGQFDEQTIVDAHANFLPNNILHRLHQRGAITLRSVPINTLSKKNLENYQDSDIWMFSLMNYQKENDITSSLIRAAHEISRTHKIKLINCTSEPRYQNGLKDINCFPLIAKPKGNGLSLNEIKRGNAFAIIQNQGELNTWKQSVTDSVSSYILEPYFCNKTENSQIFSQERWIYIFGDLTVGRRLSRERIIKRGNSVTYFKRSFENLPDDMEILKNSRKKFKEIDYAYCENHKLWQKRLEKLSEFVSKRPNLQIFSLDVIFNKNNFNIVDSNEHSYEAGTEALMELWIHHLHRNLQLRVQ